MTINDQPKCLRCATGYLVQSSVRHPNVYSCGHRDFLADIGIKCNLFTEEDLQKAFDAGMARASYEEDHTPDFEQWIEEFKKNAAESNRQ